MVDWTAWAKSAQAGLASLQKTCLQYEHEAAIKAKENDTKAFQHLFATEQKKANKRLKDNTSNRQITALQDSAGGLANTQQGLLQVAHNFFAAQAAAPTEVSPGGPLPWEDVNLDAFYLTDQTTQPGAHVLDLHALISNPALFHDLVRHLAHGKAAGPDGIPNEIIKYLPKQLLSCIHLLFILMYKSGSIPAFCKDSNMVLLYKKAEPTRLESYRPITLAHILSKLYTSLLSTTMYDFVAHHDILSDSQEGFHPNKGTSINGGELAQRR